MNKYLIVVLLIGTLSGCSTISGWFTDEEELKIRRLPEISNAFTPRILWDADYSDGTEEYFSRLRPAVDYGKVFVADRQGGIYALNPETGKLIWEQDISTPSKDSRLTNLYGLFAGRVSAKIAGGLTVAYETVFLGTENGTVLALNQEDGSIKWQAKVSGEVLAPPAVDSGVVVVNTVAGVLFGIDADTGEVKWQSETDVPPLSLRGVSAPAAANGGAIVGTASGKLVVNIIDSGLTAWEQLIAKPAGATELERIVDIDSTPLIFGGNIYVVSYGGTLAAVELRTGQVVWNREYASYQDLAIEGNRLFITDINSNLYAVDRRNGVELWSNSILRKRELTSATPVGDYIAVGDKWGYLHFFTQDEGEYVARIEVGSDDEDEGIYSAPVEHQGKLYVQLRDGELYSIELP